MAVLLRLRLQRKAIAIPRQFLFSVLLHDTAAYVLIQLLLWLSIHFNGSLLTLLVVVFCFDVSVTKVVVKLYLHAKCWDCV